MVNPARNLRSPPLLPRAYVAVADAACAFTADPTDAPLFRLIIEANERNRLRSTCRLMVDKITTVPRPKVGTRVGRLDDEDMVRLNQGMMVFLGMAVSPRGGRK
jgi:mRNA interferase MazF